MNSDRTGKNLLNLSINELLEKKKKVISHLTDLECKREQLLVLTERLSSISSERKNLLSADQGIFSRLFSMKDQLKQASRNREKIEAEISQAKEQIKSLNSILGERKLFDKG